MSNPDCADCADCQKRDWYWRQRSLLIAIEAMYFGAALVAASLGRWPMAALEIFLMLFFETFWRVKGEKL